MNDQDGQQNKSHFKNGSQPLRYAPTMELPDEAFLPGQRSGKTHPRKESPETVVEPHKPATEWRRHAAYLRGIDLYNYGFFWEAHEVWEGPWKTNREQDPTQSRFFKGLIQTAAGSLHLKLGKRQTFLRVSGRGREHLLWVADHQENYMGLNLREYCARWLGFLEDPNARVKKRPTIILERFSAEF